MATPKETIWERAPHTAAKHQILEWYLQAWFPILGKHHKRIVYLEGFAGPGEYTEGEVGSPLKAIDVALEQKAHLQYEIVFYFIEAREDRADHLRKLVEEREDGLPDTFRVIVEQGEFAPKFSGLLDDIESKGLGLAPTFALIDPFGFAGLPMGLIHRLLSYKRTEAFINFAIDPVNRFLSHPDDKVRAHMVELFGVSEDALDATAAARDRFTDLRELYQQQLCRAAKYVRYFTMKGPNDKPIYDLFFASNHPKGLEKMKEAMWRADPDGTFRFSDATDPQQAVLFEAGALSAEQLLAEIVKEFGDQKAAVVETVETWVLERTPFLAPHMRKALKLGEDERRFVVEPVKVDGKRRHGSSFPAGVVIDFTRRPPPPPPTYKQGTLFG